MISRRHISATGALAALSLLAATTAAAQGLVPFDHLKCYKVTDSIKGVYKVDLVPQQAPPFSVEQGCKLVVPAKLFCIDVQKTNVQPPPPLSVNGANTRDYLCYKVTCPGKIDFAQSVRDQFGQRPLKVKPPKLLCAPAVKVFATPTPPAETQTPTPIPTQTPSCDFDNATGQCAGPCSVPGEQCVFIVDATGVGKCDCQPPPGCTSTGIHTCGGPCPDPADICQPAPNDAGCICTHPCGFNAHGGTCGGPCPNPNEVCTSTTPPSTKCDCIQPPPPVCDFDSTTGKCGGPCPNDSTGTPQQCVFVTDPATGASDCVCQPPNPSCHPAGTFSCVGPCPDPRDQCRNEGAAGAPVDCECSHPCSPDANTTGIHQCSGDCANPTDVCVANQATGVCDCHPPTAPPCGNTLTTQCDGGCPNPGEACVPGAAGCFCENGTPPPCGQLAGNPQCLGACPANMACVAIGPVPGGSCTCQ